jgi:hypothetical protein
MHSYTTKYKDFLSDWEVKEEWNKQYTKLKMLLDRRDTERRFILYMGGEIGTFHLGERDRRELHLTGEYSGEVEAFIMDNTPEMFRFPNQPEFSSWIQELSPSWFREETMLAHNPYRATRMDRDNYKLRLDILPTYPGIYVVTDGRTPPSNAGIIYVGETERTIRQRLKTHERLQQFFTVTPRLVVHGFNQQYFTFSRRHMEKRFIARLNPLLNVRLKRIQPAG